MILYYNEKLNARIRVFISSTFRDMQAERNVIVNGVFPALRREYKNHNVDVMEVDLRWGITEKDISDMLLLEVCIGETLNCVPFFIGLLGDNYGTLAKIEEIKKLPSAYKRAIGMKSKDDVPVGVSLTELEMRAGVFVKDNRSFSRFFIRQSENSNPENLKSLKSKIIEEGYNYSSYSDIEEFETLIYEELKELVEENLPETFTAPYNDRHYVSHLKLLRKAKDYYVPNDEFIESVEKKIARERCVYLYGAKGTGKTSAFCYIIARDGNERDGDVFFHFADANEESINQDNLFNRLRRYLESLIGVTVTDPNDYNAIVEMLKNNSLEKEVTLYFDAIEKYNDISLLNKLFWLGKINCMVRVVCSGTNDYQYMFGGEKITILALTTEQIRQIAIKSLSNFGKKLHPVHMEKLLSQSECTNPLYLTTFLSQLIAYGHHETFDQFFEKLVQARGFDELFSVIIDRLGTHFAERNLGADKIYLALALIVYSNLGIKESELGDIVGFLPISRSVFLAAIEPFVAENDHVIKFNHDLITQTVISLLSTYAPELEGYVRERLVDYFSSPILSDSIRGYSERCFQLEKLGRKAELKNNVKDINCFIYLAKNQFNNLIKYLSGLIEYQDEILESILLQTQVQNAAITADIFCQSGYHKAAISVICKATGYKFSDTDALFAENASEEIAACIIASPLSNETKVRLFALCARSYYKLAVRKYSLAEKMYMAAIDFYKKTYPDDTLGLVSQTYLLGVTYKSMGNMAKAMSTLEFCAEEYKKHNVKNEISSWILAVYGNILFENGEISASRENHKQSIEDNTYIYGKYSQELAWSHSYAWAVYYTSGEVQTAFSMVKSAFSVYDNLFHSRGSKVAWAASNMGACEHIYGNFEEAKRLYSLSIQENNIILPEDKRPHPYALTTYCNYAVLLFEEGKLDECYRCMDYTLDNSMLKNGEYHLYTANILLNMGIIKRDPAIILKAIESYSKNNSPDLYFAKVCYVRVLSALGMDDEAEAAVDELFSEYLASGLDIDMLTYLIYETYGKVSWNAEDVDTKSVLERLSKFKDYRYYVTFNNNSAIVMIPHI